MSLRRLGAVIRIMSVILAPESEAGWPRASGQHGLQSETCLKILKKEKRLPTLQKVKANGSIFCRKTAYCELYEGVFLTRVGEPFSTPKETMRFLLLGQ